ncbi:MAG TPA: cell division protein ZipA [Xanthomonadaceae bacterium]|jgi:cell division protein ZipA|nr:cell division protein ZipA [Xanthomonadaceae bacterium]
MDLSGLSEANILRIAIGVAVVVLMGVIWLTGRKKPEQGLRRDSAETERLAAAFPRADRDAGRREPTLGDAFAETDGDGPTLDAERGIAIDDPVPESPTRSTLGARPEARFDRIVTLYLAARAGEVLHGPDIVVACEKAGLSYGHMGIFHRLDDNHPERGPIFSLANLVKPGSFDMARLGEVRTPGVSLFMTLPGPLNALDAWETMLPAAQRMAELLDAVLLDEERNALGRQRIAHLREEMRGYDRKRDAQNVRF